MSDYIPLFEHCPNEILLEIFDYLSLCDLIRAFVNLNQRWTNLLFSSNIHVRILYPDDFEQKTINQNYLLQSLNNHRYLSRLRLTHDRIPPHQTFINYSHIRSLILDTPISKYLDVITPEQFPCLEYLRLGYISPQSSLIKLHQKLFSNAFPFLRKCSLNNLTDDPTWLGSPSIETLGVWSDNPHLIISRLLLALFNLQSFHLFLHWHLKSPPFNPLILSSHPSLRSLRLHLNGQWSYEKLNSFLTFLPTVISLSLHSSYYDVHMIDFPWNFPELAEIFLSRLPRLSFFHCELIFHPHSSFHLSSLTSYHPSFHSIKSEIYSDDDQCIRLFTK